MSFLTKSKIFKDVIHDSIEVTKVAKCIIDTEIFQRLRDLHQLGVCYMVFPNANNNRFEHSIGTYYLAELLLINLVDNSDCIEINRSLVEVDYVKKYLLRKFNLEDNPENLEFLINLESNLLDNYLIELIKIAGLTHDLGHGPFSHLFDEWLHNLDIGDNEWTEHENRSIILLKTILDQVILIENEEVFKLNEFIDEEAFNFISELINPTENTPRNFLFQIISNSVNGLDVDKLDYIYRDSFYFGVGKPYDLSRIISHAKVIDSNICFPEKISYDIYKVYRSRYDLHKQYYNHSTVVGIEHMIRSILENLDPILKIKETIMSHDVEKFIALNDSVIMNTSKILKNFEPVYSQYKTQIDLINYYVTRLNTRNIYKTIYSGSFFTSDTDIDSKTIEILSTQQELDLSQISNFDIEKVKPVKFLIGLLSGNKKHPFDNLYFYGNKNKAKVLSKDEISHLMSTFHQEVILYLFYVE